MRRIDFAIMKKMLSILENFERIKFSASNWICWYVFKNPS